MSITTNTDAINTDALVTDRSGIPRPEQEVASIRLVDIHIYNVVAEEAIQSIETTLQEGEALPEKQQEETEWHTIRRSRRVSLLVLALSAVVVLVVIARSLNSLLVFPQTTTITIIPTSTQIQTTGTITVVTGNADATKNQIPGRFLPALTMSQTQTVATTGITHQEAQPGRGTITFYNAALSPQTIVAGTLLTGADGIQVATEKTVTVPSVHYPTLGVATVPAHAVQPGIAGNIKAGDIYGSCCVLNISAVNSVFTGGEAAQTYQSVAPSDIDTTAASLKTRLIQTGTTALQTQVHSDETLLTPTCNQTVIPDHQPGDKATQVQVTTSETCTGMTYDTESFHQQVTQAQIQAGTPQQREHYQLSGAADTSHDTNSNAKQHTGNSHGAPTQVPFRARTRVPRQAPAVRSRRARRARRPRARVVVRVLEIRRI